MLLEMKIFKCKFGKIVLLEDVSLSLIKIKSA